MNGTVVFVGGGDESLSLSLSLSAKVTEIRGKITSRSIRGLLFSSDVARKTGNGEARDAGKAEETSERANFSRRVFTCVCMCVCVGIVKNTFPECGLNLPCLPRDYSGGA